MRTLLLFTRDLRVHDHPALHQAVATSDEVVPLFVVDRRLLEVSPNRARFLLEGLIDLDRSLAQRGGRLFLREGDVVARTVEVAREAGCDRVFVTSDSSSFARSREAALGSALAASGTGFRTFPGHAVHEPGDLAPEGKEAYRVFTPYHRSWAGIPPRTLVPAPGRVAVPADLEPGPRPDPRRVAVDAFDLPPGGETHGRRHLDSYLRIDAASYEDLRNDLAADATSRLSPYLRFGFVSATEVMRRASAIPGAEGFVRQLAWRDFFGQLLASDPRLEWEDLRPGPVVELPLLDPHEALKLWEEGLTGLPLVDAGMRQLKREGWMHNRARMVVGSFLTRRLGVAWQEGARHFFRYLVDGDPANNSGGWQWVAGTGTDPRRSRSFNPVLQAKRYDPTGGYVRRYVRELADTPTRALFAPWKDPSLLRATGYPEPLVPVPAS